MSRIDLDKPENKMLLFHFLDGYINDNISVGGALERVIINYNIDENFNNFHKINVEIIHNSDYGFTNIKLVTEDMINKTKKELYIENNTLPELTNNDAFKFINENIKNKYFISNINHNNHATSIILFIDETNNINLLSFNSGLGINNHEHYTDNEITYYSPYKGISLKNYNKTNSVDYLKIITSFFLINKIYNKYQNIKNHIIMKLLIPDIKEFHNITMFISNNIRNQYFDYFLYTTLDFDERIYNNLLATSFMYDTYYDLLLHFFNFLNNSHIHNYELKFNIYYDFPNINKQIKNKIIIHNFRDDNMFIIAQQSGSCIWFSLYWPIIFYYIIYKPNKNKYQELVIKIYEIFLMNLLKLFSLENINFTIEYKEYFEVKQIYNILYNLNIIQNNLLYHEDFIYMYNFENIYENLHTGIKQQNIINIIENMENIDWTNNITFNRQNFYNMYNLYKNYNFNKKKYYKNINNKYLIIIYKLYYEYSDLFDNITEFKEFTFFKFDEINIRKINDLFRLFYTIQTDKLLNIEYINIGWALYINNFFKNKDIYHTINFDDTKELEKFLKFVSKFIILTYILNIILVNHTDFNTTDNIRFINISLYKVLSLILNEKYLIQRNKITAFDAEFQIKKENFYNFCNYLFKNNNKILQFNYINNIIPKYDILSNKDIKYSRDIDDYKKNIDFLCMNPDYIYNKYNKDDSIITNDLFIIINIYNIFNNEIHHNNLIRYYANKYYKLYKNQNKELYYILFNLQLLFEKKVSKISNDDYNLFSITNTDIITDLVFEYSLFSIIEFNNILNKILNNSKDIITFSDYLIDNKKFILNKNYILNNIIKQYVNCEIDILKDIYIIEDECYKVVKPHNIFINIFGNNDYFFNDETRVMYIINPEYIIKIFFIKNNLYYNINKIYYNNCEIIKHEHIIYPFKYIIPTLFFHMIYQHNKDSTNYNIIYLKYKRTNVIIDNININHTNITINNNNLMYPNETDEFINICENNDINYFNVIYLNSKNYENKGLQYYINNLFNNKYEFFISELSNIKYSNINFSDIVNINQDDIYNIITSFNCKSKDIIKSCTKFISKIGNCNYIKEIDKIKEYIIIKKQQIIESIECFTEYIKIINFKKLFDNYKILSDYLLNIKILNFYNDLLSTPTQDELCNQVKIYNEYFNTKKYNYIYKFEAVFELIKGKELLEEQMDKYIDIINKYDKCKKYNSIDKEFQQGGCEQSLIKPYPLHHFMMGKGKSAIMTPILSLYFSLVCKKNVYIIVPYHLVEDTKKIMDSLIHIFNLDNIIIKSDSDIKKSFFESEFIENNDNKVMLIDEFDSIIDPTKSNYNLVDMKELPTYELYKYLKPIIENIKKTNEINMDFKGNDFITNTDKILLIENDLNNILQQINNNILIENINWGIHPNKFYAIPYKSKDTPLEKSNFTSSIVTVFLTLYYYLVYNKKEINQIIVDCIKTLKLYTKIFNKKESDILMIEDIKALMDDDKVFDIIFDNIFSNLSLAKNHYNTSFIDIINIDEIYKIGYSGTININYPELIACEIFNEDSLVKDNDQEINVNYAIKKFEIKEFKIDEMNLSLIDIFIKLKIEDYDAIIDVYGLFKNYNNQIIAQEIYKYLLSIRDVIYITSNNIKRVIINNYENKYNENKKYNKPFIYYSQTHIIGTEINQNSYPIMNGLCIISKNNTTYTQVSQAIFRLRKINIGHSIHIIIIKNDDIVLENNDELIKLLIDNEKNNKKNKYIYLKYQSLKSDIRKILNKSEKNIVNIKENHKENIKYYYLEENNDENLLSNIIDTKEIEIINANKLLKKLYDEINQRDILYKLIYNINNNNIQEKNEDIEESIDNQIITQLSEGDTSFLNDYLFPNKFEYKNYDILKSDDFIKNFIKYDNIFYLPNIFNQIYGYTIGNNKSGIIFMLINENCFIIPGYLIYFYFDKYPIFNFNLVLLNQIEYNSHILDKIKEYNLFKIINNNIIDSLLFDDLNIYIVFLYLYNLNPNSFSAYDLELYKFIKCELDIKNNIKQKYIKYKQKYIKYKQKIY